MVNMNITFELPDNRLTSPFVMPFLLYRDHIRPQLEAGRKALEAMYSPVMGRPELDPVFLAGVTLLQIMERLSDRRAVQACLFDARWRMALEINADWKGFDPSTLVCFRGRVVEHGEATRIFDACLTAMRESGYLKARGPVRIDSTHVLGDLARMSRLECVRETLRLALLFLLEMGGPDAWEPWLTRYADRNPKTLYGASVERLRSTMAQAGEDILDVLAKAKALGDAVHDAQPVALLRRVFEEQFEVSSEGTLAQRPFQCAGAVHTPHEPEAQWSTKKGSDRTGWVGYKVQVCETAPETVCQKGEPTEAVITALVTQSAITGDHGSLTSVLTAHEHGGQAAPEVVHTDAGYISAPALVLSDRQGYDLCGPIPPPPHSGKRFGSDSFSVDIPSRCAVCPAGKRSSECSRIVDAQRQGVVYYFAWDRADCSACPIKDQCLSVKKLKPFRTLQVGEHHMIVQARRQLCKTLDYQARMRRRNGIEGTNSELKRGYGLRRSRYRGLAKTNLHMQFTGAACNLRRWSARSCWLAKQRATATP